MSDREIDQMPATDIELERQNYEDLCDHGWVDLVCTTCGLALGPPRMYPEDIS